MGATAPSVVRYVMRMLPVPRSAESYQATVDSAVANNDAGTEAFPTFAKSDDDKAFILSAVSARCQVAGARDRFPPLVHPPGVAWRGVACAAVQVIPVRVSEGGGSRGDRGRHTVCFIQSRRHHLQAGPHLGARAVHCPPTETEHYSSLALGCGAMGLQGDVGDMFYIVASGEVRINMDGAAIATQDVESHFGELALMHNCPRCVTVCHCPILKPAVTCAWFVWCCFRSYAGAEAVQDCKLWALDRQTFKTVVVRSAAQAVQDKVNFLKSCVTPLLWRQCCFRLLPP